MPGLSPWTVTVLSWPRSSCLSVLLSYVLFKQQQQQKKKQSRLWETPASALPRDPHCIWQRSQTLLDLQALVGLKVISVTFTYVLSLHSLLGPLQLWHSWRPHQHTATRDTCDIRTCCSLCLQVSLPPESSRPSAPPQDNPFIIFIHPICFCPSPCSVVFSEMHSTHLKIHCFKL